MIANYLNRAMGAVEDIGAENVVCITVYTDRVRVQVRPETLRYHFSGRPCRKTTSASHVHYEVDLDGVTWSACDLLDPADVAEVVL